MATLLYLLFMTWPMGHAWSSFIAQPMLLKRCKELGLDRSMVWADTAPLIVSFDACFSLASDDLMLFSVAPHDALDPSLARRTALHAVVTKHGLIPAVDGRQ